MSESRSILEKLLSSPFPDGSNVDELDELHAELAYVDAMVANAASSIGKLPRADIGLPRNVRPGLYDIVNRASRYELDAAPELARTGGEYRRYAEMLLTLIDEIDLLSSGQ